MVELRSYSALPKEPKSDIEKNMARKNKERMGMIKSRVGGFRRRKIKEDTRPNWRDYIINTETEDEGD